MSIKDLIKAADNYSGVHQRKSLIDARDEDCLIPGEFHHGYGALRKHDLADKQAYDKAEEELAAALDAYIKKRVEEVLEEYDIKPN